MDRYTLQKLFNAMKKAGDRASLLEPDHNNSLDTSIGYHRAWTAYQEATHQYNAALNEYVAEHPEPVMRTHGAQQGNGQ
ncbi:MAG: hypothetical protein WAL34_04255 [Acidobacteriaceae bacterium]